MPHLICSLDPFITPPYWIVQNCVNYYGLLISQKPYSSSYQEEFQSSLLYYYNYRIMKFSNLQRHRVCSYKARFRGQKPWLQSSGQLPISHAVASISFCFKTMTGQNTVVALGVVYY